MKILDILPTPNPVSIKFVVDTNLTPISEIISAKSDEGHSSSLVTNILEIDSVTSLMIQGPWVTVSFSEATQAKDREEQKKVAVHLRSYNSEPIEKVDNENNDDNNNDDPLLMVIRDVIQEEVLPYLNSHGGSVEVVDVMGNQVFIRYIGACGGCPASQTGTLNGIESILQKFIDPELEVVLVL